MLSRRLEAVRAASPRLSRSPLLLRRAPVLRVFTTNAQLLLLARHSPRPQLPYLSQPAFDRRKPLNGPNQQLARLLSTENRRFVQEQAWLAIKWTALGWTFLVLAVIAYFGIRLEIDERANPTPAEWSFSVRQFLRAARVRMSPEVAEKSGYTDWAKIGADLRRALELLEDTSKQGKGLVGPAEGEGILIPGVGNAGFDISAKSWPWRAGYYEVIMGCGRAAEHLDGKVLDITRGIVFPREVMIGPSNPDPRPTPPHMQASPLEENCTTPFPGPETFYMRVLTGKGFMTTQKIEAALAYAKWLEYKRLPESAQEMYKWAVDIAVDALPADIGRESVFDSSTGGFKPADGTQTFSSNLLRTSTELAIHYARHGDVSSALPILLSVLRARRNAPVSPFPLPDDSSATQASATSLFGKIFKPPQYPPPPPSGDDALTRHSDRPSCDESELMLYIGEILFATSPASSEGVGWTREAVMIADANLRNRTRPIDARHADIERKCKDCLVTGVSNWETMLQSLNESSSPASNRSWKAWLSGASSADSEQQSISSHEDLQRISELKDRIVRERLDSRAAHGQPINPSGVWIG